MSPPLVLCPLLDSAEAAAAQGSILKARFFRADELITSAAEAARQGFYLGPDDRTVSLETRIQAALAAKKSIPPEEELPTPPRDRFPETRVQVTYESTLKAAHRLSLQGKRPLALNFSHGPDPGRRTSGWLGQMLCGSSALGAVLADDPMYQDTKTVHTSDSTDWTILCPDIPVFRDEDGTPLAATWPLSVVTANAPISNFSPTDAFSMAGSDLTRAIIALNSARNVGQLLRQRIHRVLNVAATYGYDTLVLNNSACECFSNNDPAQTAADFRHALENDFCGTFSEVVFAIPDSSENRSRLRLWQDTFSPSSPREINPKFIASLQPSPRSITPP
jgi:uncharacterized protein (TIGR02452 family)